jgi:hypothetical protein
MLNMGPQSKGIENNAQKGETYVEVTATLKKHDCDDHLGEVLHVQQERGPKPQGSLQEVSATLDHLSTWQMKLSVEKQPMHSPTG